MRCDCVARVRMRHAQYYDNTIFHRIIGSFMVQGGDPTGTGKGGESIWGKPFKVSMHCHFGTFAPIKYQHIAIVRRIYILQHTCCKRR
jgi:cyclophilin family peptidyl-prolyl cis-trans isomerase